MSSLCCGRRLLAAAGCGLAVLLASGGVAAQTAAGDAAALVSEGQAWLDQALANTGTIKTPGNAPLRMEVSVGSLDARLRLAPCASVEPYMPAGMRLWAGPGWACVVWTA
jgi:flagella basal body P-ring formation protein FlgA